MPVLETMEWTNFWWPNTQQSELPRVLMIGDSISMGYRETVNKYLAGHAVASTISTSKAVDNPYILRELEYAIAQNGWKYSLVHFNNGLHGWHLSTGEYAREYASLLDKLRAAHPEIKFMLALSTPITVSDGDYYDPEKNPILLERNDVVRQIAAERRLGLDDLYSAVKDRADLRAGDGYHYNKAGYEVLGKAVADAVIGGLNRE